MYRAIQLVSLSKSIPDGISGLQLNDLSRPSLDDDEIRIAVYASAVNFFDLLMLVGKYQHKPELPFTIGNEAAGVVIEVGSEVKHFRVGDEVIAGMSNGNSMASEMVIPAAFAIPKPKSMTFAQAASLPVGFMTGYHGLVQRGKIQPGEYLLVTGAAGGMGAAAVQLGKKLGAIVIGCASTAEKCAFVKGLGADFTINYSTEDMKEKVIEYTDGNMVDVVYEIVGGKIFKQCVRCMGGEGRLLVIGFASGTIPKIGANLPLVKGFSVVGVRAGAEMALQPHYAEEMGRKLLEWTSTKKDADMLAPATTHSYPVSRFRDAFSVLAQRKVVGKACVIWRPEANAHSRL